MGAKAGARRGSRFSRKQAAFEWFAERIYRGGWAARAWGRVPGRTAVDLIRHELPLLPWLPGADAAGADGTGARDRSLTVAFASDLHIGPLTPPALLDNAFSLLVAARPDVLVLGGDYVFLAASPAMLRELEARVAAVPATVKIAVLGNHDLWTRHDLIEEALRRAGATVLINDAIHLPAPFTDVAFIGLDDPWSGRPDAARALAAAGDARLKLAVAHAPEAVPLLDGRGVRLLLCGHTHGGQIALPSGPLVIHGRCGRKWPAGLFELGEMRLFVSRGLGAVDLPFRTYARPDVSLFTLRPAASERRAEDRGSIPGSGERRFG